jgi:post-segregation antitoxin (ccd killing protein)
MSNPLHRPWRPNGETAEPRTISLTIDAELLSSAKALDIDLAASLEEMLRTTIHARNIQPVSADQRIAANCNADSRESETQPGW